MKHIFFLLLLLPVLLPAQRSLVSDSTWISNSGGVFYENHLNLYDNGETDGGFRRRLGDTMQVLRSYVNSIEGKASQLAADARIVSDFPAKVKELLRQGSAINNMIGRNPLDTLQKKYQAGLVDTTWQMRINGAAFVPFAFSVTAGGQLRYKLDTQANKNATVLGDVIRLANFNGGTVEVDLFLQKERFYTSIDRKIILRVAGSTSRSTSAPPSTKKATKQ